MKNMGKVFSKEIWNAAADHLQESAETLSEVILAINQENQGQQDKEAFFAEMQLAVTAMQYVAIFATDKCRIITY